MLRILEKYFFRQKISIFIMVLLNVKNGVKNTTGILYISCNS